MSYSVHQIFFVINVNNLYWYYFGLHFRPCFYLYFVLVSEGMLGMALVGGAAAVTLGGAALVIGGLVAAGVALSKGKGK